MQSTAKTPEEYINELPEERKEPFRKLREVIVQNLPEGFTEVMSYGMIGYVIPHSIYPKGYRADPKIPLGFMFIASQKKYIALHHMGIYASNELTEWFTMEYPKYVKSKLDMGKGCIYFKKPDQIPYALIGELATKMTTQQWIDSYERLIKR